MTPPAEPTPSSAADATRAPGAVDLLRTVGLRADGPVVWGLPVRSSRPGVYIVELVAPIARAPIDLSAVGRWIERVPTLTLDGARPGGKELAARLAAFWLPSHTVLYVGTAASSIGGRVAALYATPLGDPRPHASGHWLRTLRGPDQLRLWWAETGAAEEYADALLDAFAASVAPAAVNSLYDPTVVVPFANLQTATKLRRDHGIAGALLHADPPAAPTAKNVVVLAPAPDAEMPDVGRRARATGAGRERPQQRVRRPSIGPSPESTPVAAPAAEAALVRQGPGPTHLTAEGLDRLQSELEELIRVRRPETISRIRSARELGDLSENADYEAARKDQSFLEGRIQQLQDMLRNVALVDGSPGGDDVAIGSTVIVESRGTEATYTIVGSAESNPREGRLSFTSPIGTALLGHRAGDDVIVHAPRGDVTYRIVEVR
jgi:transcription elongation factor GreA